MWKGPFNAIIALFIICRAPEGNKIFTSVLFVIAESFRWYRRTQIRRIVLSNGSIFLQIRRAHTLRPRYMARVRRDRRVRSLHGHPESSIPGPGHDRHGQHICERRILTSRRSPLDNYIFIIFHTRKISYINVSKTFIQLLDWIRLIRTLPIECIRLIFVNVYTITLIYGFQKKNELVNYICSLLFVNILFY